MERFEKGCRAVLQTADILLKRYPRHRRRPGTSLAGRILYPCLTVLPGVEAFLAPEHVQRFQQLEAALAARYALLRQRRIPLCGELYRFHSRCQALIRVCTDVPSHWDSPSVLLGTLRTLNQLDICLECGFYHVPARLIPLDRLPIDYVAIYQSRLKYAEDCGVQYYGRVKSCTPVRRWQIREIPRDSDELYYRLEVEAWEQLEVPVRVLEIPFNHLFTNLFLLTHSQETPELTLKKPVHYVFYQALKYALQLGDGTVFRHRGGAVRLTKELFQVYRHGRKIAAFVAEDFHRVPAEIFHQLIHMLEKKP